MGEGKWGSVGVGVIWWSMALHREGRVVSERGRRLAERELSGKCKRVELDVRDITINGIAGKSIKKKESAVIKRRMLK